MRFRQPRNKPRHQTSQRERGQQVVARWPPGLVRPGRRVVGVRRGVEEFAVSRSGGEALDQDFERLGALKQEVVAAGDLAVGLDRRDTRFQRAALVTEIRPGDSEVRPSFDPGLGVTVHFAVETHGLGQPVVGAFPFPGLAEACAEVVGRLRQPVW